MSIPSGINSLSEENLQNISPISQNQKLYQNEGDTVDSFPMLAVARSHLDRVGNTYQKYHRKDQSPMEMVCRWIVKHQIGLSINLLVLLSLTHICFPRARRHSRKFFELSYYNSETGKYRAGWNDSWMVFYWIVVFTGLRATVMDYGLMFIAQKGGIKSERGKVRFAEQAWLLIYYSVFWTLGMYIMINSEYWLNFKELWTNWPNREIGGLHKWYILVQYAFWLQQILVINVEKRRKDHWQMFTHHIVTTILIFTSYGYHQTRVANLILCVMDVVDIILPIAKCLKYLGYSTLCDIIFCLFMLIWFVARHVIYIMICWSVFKDIPENIQYGCYRGKNGAITGPFIPESQFSHLFEPFRDPEGVVCWNNSIKWGFLSALLFLQGITLLWFWMILQVALRVLRGGQADDSRSDDEEENIEENKHENEKQMRKHQEKIEYENFVFGEEKRTAQLGDNELHIPIELDTEMMNLKARRLSSSVTRSRYIKKGNSNATGISLAGHMDRKDLLGRIGCDHGI